MFAEGIDDDGAEVEEFRSNLRGSLRGDGVQVGECEVAPFQPVEMQEHHFVLLLESEATEREMSFGTPFHLSLNASPEVLVQIGKVRVEAFAAHRVEQWCPRVEESFVGMPDKWTHIQIRHEPLQFVSQRVARLFLCTEEFLLIGENQ